jgi:hypothetical protein
MLTETLVAHDLGALADAGSQRVVLRHWRDNRNQREVDLLVVHPDGRTVPIEVKASTSVGPDDTAGLRAYMDAAGQQCERAILIYEGDRIVDLTPSTDCGRTEVAFVSGGRRVRPKFSNAGRRGARLVGGVAALAAVAFDR